MSRVTRIAWSSLVLLGASACGGGSHSPGQGSPGAAGISNGGSNVGNAGSGSTAGKLGSGGSITAGGAPATGSGGQIDGAGAGTETGLGGAGASGAPGMTGACLGSEIDIPSATVTGTIKLLDTDAGNYGTLSLSNGTDSVALGTTATQSYSVHAVPGTYDLLYTGKSNGVFSLKTGVVVARSGSTLIDIAVPHATIIAPSTSVDYSAEKVTLSGMVTVDGQRPPPHSSDTLRLSARRPGSGWEVFTTSFTSTTSGDRYSGTLLPATYEIGFDSGAGGLFVSGWLPSEYANYGILARGVVITKTATERDIDLRTAPISGAFTLDGAALPAGCRWTLLSSDVASASFALDATGAYTGRVPPGTYDLIYLGADNASTCSVKNIRSALKRGIVVPVAGTTVPRFDAVSVQVSGRFSLGGAALSNAADDGSLSLRTAEGDNIPLGKLSAGTFTTRVLPGSYDLYFTLSDDFAPMLAPANSGKIKSVVLSAGAPITLDIDVPSTVISGTVKIGGSLVDKEYDGGRLWLGEPHKAGSFALTWTSTGKYSARVIPGTYDLYYEGTSPSALAPFNTKVKLGCFQTP